MNSRMSPTKTMPGLVTSMTAQNTAAASQRLRVANQVLAAAAAAGDVIGVRNQQRQQDEHAGQFRRGGQCGEQSGQQVVPAAPGR